MAANIWGELIKQGFENFRSGLNNLSQGTASIAQGANQGIQPFQGQAGGGMVGSQFGQQNFGGGLAGIAERINSGREAAFPTMQNPNLSNNILGREIQTQTAPTFNSNPSASSGTPTALNRAISQQAPSLFDRLSMW
jgi:hypothetical protein